MRHKMMLPINKAGKTAPKASPMASAGSSPAQFAAPATDAGQYQQPPPPVEQSPVAPAGQRYHLLSAYSAQKPQQAQQKTVQYAQEAVPQGAVPAEAPPPDNQLPQSPGASQPVKGSAFAGKTGIIEKGKIVTPGKPIDIQKNIAVNLETVLEQMQIYLEICDSLSDRNWIPQNLIDMLLLLTRSLNFDAVSLVFADPALPNKLAQPVSRGYKAMPPPMEVVEVWQKALDGKTRFDWEKLMKTASDNHSPLASWILVEGMKSFAYIPVFDLAHIYGFVFISSYSKMNLTPISTMILELCGGRIGLSLAARGSSGTWPEAVLNSITELRDQLSLIIGYFEMANESGELSPQEMKNLFSKCSAAVSESVQLIDRLSRQAIAPSE